MFISPSTSNLNLGSTNIMVIADVRMRPSISQCTKDPWAACDSPRVATSARRTRRQATWRSTEGLRGWNLWQILVQIGIGEYRYFSYVYITIQPSSYYIWSYYNHTIIYNIYIYDYIYIICVYSDVDNIFQSNTNTACIFQSLHSIDFWSSTLRSTCYAISQVHFLTWIKVRHGQASFQH